MTLIASTIPLTRKPVSSRSRSIAKTLTWRVFAELDTFLVSYLITGSMTWSLSIVGIESTTKTVLYYLHERAWGHIAWGVIAPRWHTPADMGRRPARPDVPADPPTRSWPVSVHAILVQLVPTAHYVGVRPCPGLGPGT